MHTFLIGYLGFGFLLATYTLYKTRNFPGSVVSTFVDAVDITLFYPSLTLRAYRSYKKYLQAAPELAKYEKEYAKNPEKFKQDTVIELKKLMEIMEAEVKKEGTKRE